MVPGKCERCGSEWDEEKSLALDDILKYHLKNYKKESWITCKKQCSIAKYEADRSIYQYIYVEGLSVEPYCDFYCRRKFIGLNSAEQCYDVPKYDFWIFKWTLEYTHTCRYIRFEKSEIVITKSIKIIPLNSSVEKIRTIHNAINLF